MIVFQWIGIAVVLAPVVALLGGACCWGSYKLLKYRNEFWLAALIWYRHRGASAEEIRDIAELAIEEAKEREAAKAKV